ncbi:MAG: DsbA family oxidoreductase [Trueperaceae bacterium]
MKIEIWSDVVCPWCYIGKRRLESALSEFEHAESVQIVWRSFELDPYAPGESGQQPVDEMLAGKYGVSLERAREMNAQVTELAEAEGVEFRLDVAKRANTFDAHRLIHLAAENGLQQQAKERLLAAYFSEGKPIGERETLTELAAEIGIDRERAAAALAGDEFADEVRADERRAQELGANGVPFFVFDQRYGISGAQSPDVFLQVLERTWSETRPLTILGNDAGSNETDPGRSDGEGYCDDGGCEVVDSKA